MVLVVALPPVVSSGQRAVSSARLAARSERLDDRTLPPAPAAMGGAPGGIDDFIWHRHEQRHGAQTTPTNSVEREMRRALIIAALLSSTTAASGAECLSSAADVWIDHPGTHATWKMDHGRKCWHARGAKIRRQKVHDERVPVPRDRPRYAQRWDDSGRVFAFQGAIMADELLGRDKFIDRWPDTHFNATGFPVWLWPNE
jgi:hypothetical protein